MITTTVARGGMGVPHARVAIVNGKLLVEHPPGGPYPVIVPCPEVELLINGKPCRQEVAVRMEDTVSLSALCEDRKGTWSLRVSPDGLKAFISVTPGTRVTRVLPDHPFSDQLVIRVEEVVERVPAASINELMSGLKSAGVVLGLDMGALARLAGSTTPGESLVAEGTPPIAGQDATIELFFKSESWVAIATDEQDEVDFRSRFEFTAVRQGQILAKKEPPVPGKFGKGVRGEMLAPREPADVELIAGEGVLLQDWANNLVAIKAGRPVTTQSSRFLRIDVMPDMVIKGNVNLATGNISFIGDVAIAGDISPGFTVWSGGQVRVEGYVENSLVQALNCVAIKENVMSSQVLVGPPHGFLRVVVPVMEELLGDTRRLSSSIQQLKKLVPEDKKPFMKQLIAGLLEQRDEGFRDRVKLLAGELAKIDPRALELLDAESSLGVARFLKETEKGPRTEEHIADLARLFAGLNERLGILPKPEQAYLTARNVMGSTLVCTGDILIQGGCYNSRVQAGGKVTVKGVFRGGELKSGGDVRVRELGSESAVCTAVVCPTSARVYIDIAWENSSVMIGPRKHNFHKRQLGVSLYLEEGNLLLR